MKRRGVSFLEMLAMEMKVRTLVACPCASRVHIETRSIDYPSRHAQHKWTNSASRIATSAWLVWGNIYFWTVFLTLTEWLHPVYRQRATT